MFVPRPLLPLVDDGDDNVDVSDNEEDNVGVGDWYECCVLGYVCMMGRRTVFV